MVIMKEGESYVLKSHTGKNLGHGSKEEMKKREKQVNYFKYLEGKK